MPSEHRPWMDFERDDIARRTRAGETQVSIAEQYGVSVRSIRRVQLREGSSPRAMAIAGVPDNSDWVPAERDEPIQPPVVAGPFLSFPDMQPAHATKQPCPQSARGSAAPLYGAGPGSSPGAGSVPPDRVTLLREVDRLRRRLADERGRRWAAEDDAERSRRVAGVVEALETSDVELPPIVPHRHGKGRMAVVPVMCLSDLHVEERVRLATVNGMNEYDEAVAERRMAYLFEGYAWHLEQLASFYSIERAMLWLGGDLVSGFIHEEQLTQNTMMPPPAVCYAEELVARGISYLLTRCPWLQTIDVVCSFGNHARISKKKWISASAESSYEWIIYHQLRKRFAAERRVQWQIAAGEHTYATIYGQTLRFTHGDSVQFGNGIGGLTIPLRKKVLAWDKTRPADVTVIGHFHQCTDFGYAVVNGSVVGWNPFAISIGAFYEPPRQALFVINEDFGRQTFTHVYCDPDRKAGRAAA